MLLFWVAVIKSFGCMLLVRLCSINLGTIIDMDIASAILTYLKEAVFRNIPSLQHIKCLFFYPSGRNPDCDGCRVVEDAGSIGRISND